MHAVIFVGIQGCGKTTLYRERFFETHIRLSMDMLRTRHREGLLLAAMIGAKQPFVIDNTNPTRAERKRYIEPARAAGFRVTGYYFRADVDGCLMRNADRPERQRVPTVGLLDTYKRLELPAREEGFDDLWYVQINADNGFEISEWRDEV